jgi:hypothetical protein
MQLISLAPELSATSNLDSVCIINYLTTSHDLFLESGLVS